LRFPFLPGAIDSPVSVIPYGLVSKTAVCRVATEATSRSRIEMWEVEILTAEEGIMSVYVDADSGSVITTDEKMTGMKPAQE
jgi:hypothetical protein